ncbi:MAG: hypothetical protein WEC75_12865 [Dehalococcoidia bacterium]
MLERVSLHALVAVATGGLALRLLIDWANHHGPSGDGWSLRGNGALVFALLIPLLLIAAEMLALLRRKWLAIPLIPIALAAGMFLGGLFGV